jgi:glycosyltransferase involved in cell wall biosynthesis
VDASNDKRNLLGQVELRGGRQGNIGTMSAVRNSLQESTARTAPTRSQDAGRPIKLALMSSGLGRINRGFEITTARWYEAVSGNSLLSTRLYAGSDYAGAHKVWNIPRDLLLNSPLKIFSAKNERAFWEFCYTIEQISFSLCLADILSWRPEVVWTKEIPLAHFLLVYKYMFNLPYKIIFANGGAFKPSTYKDFDFIQHLHPDSFAEAKDFGIPEKKMQLLPNCVFYKNPALSRAALRTKFGYAEDDWIIISVAAWNSFQKRLDYLIDEVASIEDGRVKLLLCGQPELETDTLKARGAEKLGDRIKWMTLQPEEVHEALSMADVFVLPSFREGLASSIIESAMAGIPTISHPHSGGKYILQDECWLTELNEPTALRQRLLEIRSHGVPADKLARLKKSAYERFSPAALADKFVDMVTTVTA